MMIRRFVVMFLLLGLTSQLSGQDANRAPFSPKESVFEVTTEKLSDREALVLKLNGDGATLPPLRQTAVVPGALLGTMVDAKTLGKQLAIVQDIGGISLRYQRYELQDGDWVKQGEKMFFALTTRRSQALCLVRLESIDKVRVTLLKEGEDFSLPVEPGSTVPRRTVGQPEAGDPSFLFQFNSDGVILRDGQPYEGGGND